MGGHQNFGSRLRRSCKVAIGRYAVRAGVSVLVELNMFVSEEVEEPLSPKSRRAVVSNLIKLREMSGNVARRVLITPQDCC